MLSADRSAVIVNTHEEMPSDFIRDRDFVFPGKALLGALRMASRPGGVATLDATRLASALLGDSIGANVLMLGFAFQRGLLPVSGAALYRALELYGRNVDENKLAFDWGRFAAESPEQVERLAKAKDGEGLAAASVPEAIARRAQFLTAYQNGAYAERYRSQLDRIAVAEQRIRPGSQLLQEAVAGNYFYVLAYKDEYEVARLHTESGFVESVRRNFGAGARMSFHFSPPLIAKVDPTTGRPRKYELGPWVLPLLRMLAKLRWLRGSRLNPFGWSADRRLERELLASYERLLGRIGSELDDARFDVALALARLPEQVRGFGPIKRAAAERARAAEVQLWRQWNAPVASAEAPRASAA
jgi:indolepyruvate ferredoxin oxidoreductase